MGKRDDMSNKRYLLKRRQTWYIRVSIPPSQRHKFNGRDSIVRSLKTRDLEEARRRRWKAKAEIEEEITRKITGADIIEDAVSWRDSREETVQQNMDALGYTYDEADRAISLTETDKAEEIEKTHGYTGAKRWYDVASDTGLPTSLAMKLWQEEAATTEKTKAEQQRAIQQFLDFSSDVLVEKVTRRMAGSFVSEVLIKGPGKREGEHASPATINKKISALSSLWRFLKRRGYVKDNPWSDQGVKVGKSKKRAYTFQELLTITTEPSASKLLRDVMTVAICTGLRIENIACLRREDVEDQGVHIREGKTDSAIQWIPLGHGLIRA